MEQMQPALRAYLTKLREDAYIDISQGFVDSGASAKQTKPVFTAYAAPVSKKQKKEAQEKKRFDRGGRFSAAKTAPAPAVTPVATTATAAAATTTTTATATTTAKASNPAKPKKIKREKVRYGQAPRNALPAGPQEAGVGGDTGEGAAAAPGAAMTMAPQNTTQIATASDDNPLTPKAPVAAKTRYSARAKTEKADKEAARVTKTKEKAALTPAPMSTDEKATAQTQAAPLGLNGDTAKKKKKTKVAGAPKERLQDKEKQAPVAAPAPEPTVNPALGPAPGEPTPPPAPAPAPPATTPKN
jgi:peptidyl-prolyl cis-trans isomerase SurA